MLDLVGNSGFSMFHPRLPNSAYLMSVSAVNKHIYKRPTAYTSQCPRRYSRIKAAAIIREHSETDVVHVSTLKDRRIVANVKYLEVADSNGRIYCVDRNVATSCWLKMVRLAEDCQSSNVELRATETGVYLKSTKTIVQGEPLSMWFGGSILAMLDMPYLTKQNILAKNDYMCHRCDRHFETPNPLKIHLMTLCNRMDESYLWLLLSKQFRAHIAPQPSLGTFEMAACLPGFGCYGGLIQSANSAAAVARYSPIGSDSGVSSSLNLSADGPPSPNLTVSPVSPSQASPPSPSLSCLPFYPASASSPIKKPLHPAGSAFKPYVNSSTAFPEQLHSGGVFPILGQSPYTVLPMPQPAPARPDANAAEMETIVSNMGKSKTGHVCLYCGKVYSRKYGLKIHIRTHTGYKPLKCKVCLRAFGDPSNLNKHVRLHADGDTPYKCDLCGKVMVRRRDLERHMRSRHNSSDYSLGHDMSDSSSSDGSDMYS